MKIRYLIDVFLTSIGFGALAIWGPNPYTNFVFVACMFFGSPIARRYGKSQPKIKIDRWAEVLRGGRLLAFLGAAFAASWIGGEENFLRVVQDIRFLSPVWLWVQLVIVEAHFRPQPQSNTA